MSRLFFIVWVVLLAPLGLAEESALGSGGEVRVPLPNYTQLIERSRAPKAPAPFAIGHADISAVITQHDDQTSAQVDIAVTIQTFESSWTLVPLLPLGVALSQASIDGQAVPLVQTPDGLAWSTDRAGTVNLHLSYQTRARRSEHGYTLNLSTPRAASTALNVVYPGVDADLAVMPSNVQHHIEENGRTRVSATVPPTDSIVIAWRSPGLRDYALSRAYYRGELIEQAVVWTAKYQVEVFAGDSHVLPLLPNSLTLVELSVDGQAATVLEENNFFTILVSGQGLHQIEAVFQTPVRQADGPPWIDLRIPRVPMSQFELRLPGAKEIQVTPAANVIHETAEDHTEAQIFMPLAENLRFTWLDAVPQDLQVQVRANASLYHSLYAEEGVLHGQAIIAYEISRGELNQLELNLPIDALVNRVQGDGIIDWTVLPAEGDASRKQLKVFLNRAVQGEYILTIAYERLLGPDQQEAVTAPILQAQAMQRQRGMLALLAGPELILKPLNAEGAAEVGENQLPAFVRNQISQPVEHTYKYTELPTLSFAIAAPERKQGQFDAQIDTLISIGEVSMRASATVEINLKAGSLMDLALQLPENVNVLNVTGPALRARQVHANEAGQIIQLEFNREMDGQFRIEVAYERLMNDGGAEFEVPTLQVSNAEVAHGRIAVEALTAVEVQASTTEQLSSLDINELPQQLVLKTTNPILLAYKYVGAEPPARLALRMIRHRQIDVQVAAIEDAHYQSLITRDGLAVTKARFLVRNSRRQFLRLDLPEHSQVWSAFVDGQAEKPARAGDNPAAVLIKLINSASGFPVEIVYAAPVQTLELSGTLSYRLPRPDIIVTNSRWDVYLPVGPHYRIAHSDLDIIQAGRWTNPRRETSAAAGGAETALGQPLRIEVPTQGIHFGFTKLYANQSTEDVGFIIRYVALELNRLGWALSVIGALLIWAGIIVLWNRRLWNRRAQSSRWLVAILFLLGAGLLLAAIGYLQASPLPASVTSIAVALIGFIGLGLQRFRAWRQSNA